MNGHQVKTVFFANERELKNQIKSLSLRAKRGNLYQAAVLSKGRLPRFARNDVKYESVFAFICGRLKSFWLSAKAQQQPFDLLHPLPNLVCTKAYYQLTVSSYASACRHLQ